VSAARAARTHQIRDDRTNDEFGEIEQLKIWTDGDGDFLRERMRAW
jgi:hypothetical protein